MNLDRDEEIEKRISEMESPDYQFVKRMEARDYLLLIIVCVICFAAIIGGAYL